MDSINSKPVNDLRKKTGIAFKAARLTQRLSRKEAAVACRCSPQAIEQIENARCGISEARLRHFTALMEMSWETFQGILAEPQKHLAQAMQNARPEKTRQRKPRRNEYKLITKEARVIRSLRRQKGLSQSEASHLCGYGPQAFSFIEAGRVELTEEKVAHILSRFGVSFKTFQALVAAPILRDELIEQAERALHLLSDQALAAAISMIKELSK